MKVLLDFHGILYSENLFTSVKLSISSLSTFNSENFTTANIYL